MRNLSKQSIRDCRTEERKADDNMRKDEIRRRTKKIQKKRSSETKGHEKQRLATLKRLKRGYENELERKLRLEKVVTSKQLSWAEEAEEERRARLENDSATKWLRLAMEMEEERKHDWSRWYLPIGSGWPWTQMKKEKKDWRR